MIEEFKDIKLNGTRVVTQMDELPERCVAASIGVFDGVHCGHVWLIENLRRFAVKSGLKSAVITFRNHPQNVLRPDGELKLLMPIEARIEKLASTGIDFIILMDFTEELSKLDSTEFIRLVSEHYGVGALLMGFNHRFGHNRKEQFADYVKNGEKLGVKIDQAEEFKGLDSPVSSSIIRKLIDSGDVADVAVKLGSPFRLSGKVVHGFARGRQIGFPTANIDVDKSIIIPHCGVYAVKVRVGDEWYGGMANIGVRPTFDDGSRQSIEVNIFDFAGNIYGNVIDVDFIQHLRDEQPMKSIDDLKAQLEADMKEAKQIIGSV